MKTLLLALSAITLFGQAQQKQDRAPMTFFLTSVGVGDGANLGGLAGADAHCQKLAAAAGAGNRTWRAYLSTSAGEGKPAQQIVSRLDRFPRTHGGREVVLDEESEQPFQVGLRTRRNAHPMLHALRFFRFSMASSLARDSPGAR